MADIKGIFDGLLIFIKWGLGNDYIQAEHDMIYGPSKDSMLLSLAELEILDEAGWHIEDDECWAYRC